ncbi:MAG: carbamoylphosphate synthase large subunit short form [Dorea sp.]|jgi:hypothetical protein|nr:carbamoylphosphate synthase large subunit short form [Dorea sp.]
MNSKIGVLIFPAGEINSVELHDALSTCVNLRLYGASSVDRHGEYIFKNYISGVPYIRESNFLSEFNRIIKRHHIDVVIPTHDDIALFLAKEREHIKAKVLTADYKTALVCRDKKETYELFSEYPFCPKTYETLKEFPVFIKPRKGQGSVNAKCISCAEDIPPGICLPEYTICEYLPGHEMTVDCFTSRDGKLQAVLPRSRQRIFGGISVRGQTEAATGEIRKIAETINSKLSFLGLWYFQIRQDQEGNYKLLEISARCAGSMCLSRGRGVNLPLLSVYAAMGKDTEILENHYRLTVDRTFISRYKGDFEYNRVYIDLDDTVLINGRVNLQSIQFIYQCVNEKKQIILLTRHKADHADSAVDALQKHRISAGLFDEIIEIPFDIPKYTVIQPDGAIFIDNAFAERKSVYKHLGIPVFDVDGIEVLLDWRT